MKRIFAITIVLLLVAGSAYAVEMETKGMYYVRGSYISNNDGLIADDVPSYGYYDQELDMTVGLKVSDYTKVNLNFEIRDQSWHQSQLDDSTISDGEQWDDMIEFKRVFGQHTFATGTTVLAGLQTGDAWGTSFGDTANGVWKVQVLQMLPFGMIGGNFQKDWEEGEQNPTVDDAEKDDGDTYYLFAVLPVGTNKIMPLFRYSKFSQYPYYAAPEALRPYVEPLDRDSNGLNLWAFDIAAMGAFGTIGYEAEFVYANYNQDWDGGEDYATYGAYLNVWGNVGSTKIGGMVAYGSWDNDGGAGYGFGEDFTPTMFGADWTNIGSRAGTTAANDGITSSGYSEYAAVTLGQIYANFALSEALSLFANGTYWMSNADQNADGTNNFWKDATGYEIDLGGDYKITENVTYGVLAAYGQIQLDEDAAGYDDADAFYRLYHKFTINF